MTATLDGLTILVPETRELDLFVMDAIRALIDGRIGMVAFTASPQVQAIAGAWRG